MEVKLNQTVVAPSHIVALLNKTMREYSLKKNTQSPVKKAS